MENTLWNGKLYTATEIADEYILEKEIRKASGRKELRCPDPECQHPVLRYCHGEIKDAFFAHLNNELCDYANFDKENTPVIRTIRRMIYENFKNKGYKVRVEVKVLNHHYTHLLFEMFDGNQIALEIGTQNLSANKIEKLTEEYRVKGIAVKWIVVGNINNPVRENQTFFMKRYLLNESKNKDLLVINWDGSEVAQYKADTNRYEYNGQIIQSKNYADTYTEYAALGNIDFDDNELSITGFHSRYQEWLTKKRSAFNKHVIHLKEEQKQMEEFRLKKSEEERLLSERHDYLKTNTILHMPDTLPTFYANDHNKVSNTIMDKVKPTYEQCREKILPNMDQQTTPVRDSLGRRWIKCKLCAAIETEDKFWCYGGNNQVNLGECKSCRGKNKN